MHFGEMQNDATNIDINNKVTYEIGYSWILFYRKHLTYRMM